MFNNQQLYESLLVGSNAMTLPQSIVSSSTTNNNNQFQNVNLPTNHTTNNAHSIHMNNINPHINNSVQQTTNNNNPTTLINNNITNESLLQQQLLYNQLVLMNQALSHNILIMSTPNTITTTNQQLPTMYHNNIISGNNTPNDAPGNSCAISNLMNNSSCVQTPSLLSVLSSLTATNNNVSQQSFNNNLTNNHSTIINTGNNLVTNVSSPSPYTCASTNIPTTSSGVNNNLMINQQSPTLQPLNLHQEMEDVAKPWLFMLENMLKQRPTNTTITPQTSFNNNSHPIINHDGQTSNSDTFYNYQQPQYSRESNLSPSIFQELDDIIGSIDPNVDICEKLSFEKKEEKPAFNVIVKHEENLNIDSNNNSSNESTSTPVTSEEKKKRTKRTGGGQGRGGNTGGKYLAESASREVSPTFDYFIHSSDNSTIVKADFDGIVLTPHERCLCALLSKAILPKEDLKSLITGPNSVTLRCIISKWIFGKLDVSTSFSAEESTGSDQSVAPLTMICDPMGFTVNKSAKPTRLSVFVNDTLKLRIRPCSFEKSSLFSADTIIADISIFDQNMMNLFIGHYSIEMRSAHYLTGLAGGLSKESDLSTTNIMNTPDICMQLLSENSIVQFTEDLSKSSNNNKANSGEPFDVCVSVRRDHHYKVKLPPIKEVSMSLGFGNTSPNSALNKKISFIQIIETDSQRPVCRSEPFWCRSKSRAEMEKKQNREAMQRKTVKKDGDKKRKPKSPSEQEKKRKLEVE